MKVLKNCKILKERIEEFPLIQIRYDDEVFVDLPICAIEFGQTLERPVLFSNGSQVPLAVELSWVQDFLKDKKRFNLLVEPNGRVSEVEPEKANYQIRLPKETIIEELMFENGNFVRARKDDPNVN